MTTEANVTLDVSVKLDRLAELERILSGGSVDELRGMHELVGKALEAAIKATPVPLDHGRCEVCSWPFASRREAGCVPGDCSYRDPAGAAVLAERRAAIDARRVLPEELAAGRVSAAEAMKILERFNATFWHPRGRKAPDGVERARYSIPPDPRRDDDIRLAAFIMRTEDLIEAVDAVLGVVDASSQEDTVELAQALSLLRQARALVG